MNIQTHCRQCAKAYQLGYAEATEYYRNQLSELLSIKSCPEPIMMVPVNEECVAQNAVVLAATDSQQLKAEIRSLLARYDGYRSNDGEKAPGWLLHELRELSAV